METYQIFVFTQESVPSKKHKNDKDGASITPVKTDIDTVEKEEKSMEIMLKKPTHLLYHQKRRLTQSTKQRNHRHTNKQSILPKSINLTHLTQ